MTATLKDSVSARDLFSKLAYTIKVVRSRGDHDYCAALSTRSKALRQKPKQHEKTLRYPIFLMAGILLFTSPERAKQMDTPPYHWQG